MIQATQIRSRRIAVCCAIILLLASTFLVACQTNESQDQGPTVEVGGSAIEGSESYDARLLELELIGYANAARSFIELDTSQVNGRIDSGEDFFLFIGRPTCEWCRKVAPSLQEAASSIGIEMFYLDSTNSESDELLADFRERYEVATVPAILHFQESGYTNLDVDVTSDTIREDLEQLLEEEVS